MVPEPGVCALPGSEVTGGVGYWRGQGCPRQLLETPWGLSCGGSWIPVEMSSFPQFAQTSRLHSTFFCTVLFQDFMFSSINQALLKKEFGRESLQPSKAKSGAVIIC